MQKYPDMMVDFIGAAQKYPDMMVDFIGAESCADFCPDAATTFSRGGGVGTKFLRRSHCSAAKEYPPVIPSLCRTTKYNTRDGRLVIKEENVTRRREYLQAHRSGGRLVINLVPLDGGADENVEEIDGGDEVANGQNTAVHSEKGKCGGFAAAVAVAELRPPVLAGDAF